MGKSVKKQTPPPSRLDVKDGEFVIIIPAYNEEAFIGILIDEIRRYLKNMPVVVINDGSRDSTEALARSKNVVVLDLPCNLGVGGAVQTGFKYALDKGFNYVIRIDGDGQHPPSEIPKMIGAMRREDADLIVGSRFNQDNTYVNSPIRSIGIKLLAAFISLICRSRITDPTSGFWILNRKLLTYFAHDYPSDYPEPEAIALLRRHGYSFKEQPVAFRQRTSGESSIHSWGTVYYVIKVGLALVVDRIKPKNRRYQRSYYSDL